MFTGIVQNRARVLRKQKKSTQIHFCFQLDKKEKALEPGESLSIDGVCLTVARCRGKTFEVDVIPETLQATTLGELFPGDRVNVERALAWGTRLGGHFVTGHVDGRGKVIQRNASGKDLSLRIRPPRRLMRYFPSKASVAIQGVSLTIQKSGSSSFSVGLIPFTRTHTNLGQKKMGDWVNLEVDLLARYLLGRSGKEKEITRAFNLQAWFRKKENSSKKRSMKQLQQEGF